MTETCAVESCDETKDLEYFCTVDGLIGNACPYHKRMSRQ